MTAELNTEGFMLLNDQPIRAFDGDDVLGTHDAAVHLAALIEASRESTPFTVGIDAGWGMGKSSLMLQMKELLDAKSDASGFQSVWFNAWTAEGAHALDGLIKSVLLSLDENVLRRGLRRIASKRQLLSGLRIATIIIASYFHLTRVADEIWNRLSADARSRNAIRAQMADMFQQWTARTKRTPKGRTLVVFIDDLDRCSNDVILEVCEAMKLYLDVPGIAFVVGCDQAVLGQATHAAARLSQNVANASYLEKIIQVTYTKPMPFDDQVAALIDSLARASGTQSFINTSVKAILIDRAGRNPRRIKRLINSFILEYRLDSGWADFGAEALMTVILMRQFYADFYHTIANPSAENIAAEFLSYLDVRNRFQMASPPTDEDRRFFASHKVRSPGDQYGADDLGRLEQELPVSFPVLARDTAFEPLLRSLSGRSDFDSLRHRLQRHPIAAVTPQFTGVPPGGPRKDDRDLAGLSVLWIDDSEESIAAERAAITGLGASVEVVSSGAAAHAVLGERSPDVLVSDITRYNDSSAGLTDLKALQESGLYRGPAIFYTGRLTPSRIRSAEELGALITTDRDALLDHLQAFAVSAARPVSAQSQQLTSDSVERLPEASEPGATWSAGRGLAQARRWSKGDL